MNIEIQRLQAEQIEQLSVLAKETYSETFGHSLTQKELHTILKESKSIEYFKSVIKDDTIFVAIHNTKVLGYIQISNVKINIKNIEIKKNDKAVNAIYVKNAFQGKGIGKELISHSLKYLKLKGIKRVFIDVWDENKRAVNFYVNYGFKNVGKCDVVIDNQKIGYDLVLMKSL